MCMCSFIHKTYISMYTYIYSSIPPKQTVDRE